MKSLKKNSFLAIIAEYAAKSMVYAIGYFMARKMPTVEFGAFTAALAFSLVVTIITDSGMGQVMAKQLAESGEDDKAFIRQMFTWRYGMIIAATLMTMVSGRLFLPTAAYKTAIWLTPCCLAINLTDLCAWILRGLQNIPGYCLMLVGSRLLLFILSIIALHQAPDIHHMLLAYGISGIISALISLIVLSRYIGSLRFTRLGGSSFSVLLINVYKYGFVLVAGVLMTRVDLMLVAKLCGEMAAGLYGCAAFVIDGLNLVPMAVYGVCLPAFAAARKQSTPIVQLFEEPFMGLCVASLLIVIWVPMLSHPLFHAFFGDRYALSANYLDFLLWSCIPYYVNSLLWALLFTRNELKTLAISIVIGLSSQVLFDLAVLPHDGPLGAAVGRTVGMTVAMAVCLIRIWRLDIVPVRQLIVRPALLFVIALCTRFICPPHSFTSGLLNTAIMLVSLRLSRRPTDKKVEKRAKPAIVGHPPIHILAAKTFYWIIYSFKLGKTLGHKFLILYMAIRWKLATYLSPVIREIFPLPDKISIVFKSRTLSLHIADDNSFPYLFYEIFIGQDYHLELNHSPECIIDAGAHYGLASLYFSCLYPDAKIHAFEPYSRNYRHLKLNTAQFPNISTYPMGLSSKAGEAWLYLHPSSGENSLIAPHERGELIQVTTLDDFIIEHHLSYIDILKIDVEGAEEQILTGTKSLTRFGHILGEVHLKLSSWPHISQVLSEEFDLTYESAAPGCGFFKARKRGAKDTETEYQTTFQEIPITRSGF